MNELSGGRKGKGNFSRKMRRDTPGGLRKKRAGDIFCGTSENSENTYSSELNLWIFKGGKINTRPAVWKDRKKCWLVRAGAGFGKKNQGKDPSRKKGKREGACRGPENLSRLD